jgi:hypothetical protein
MKNLREDCKGEFNLDGNARDTSGQGGHGSLEGSAVWTQDDKGRNNRAVGMNSGGHILLDESTVNPATSTDGTIRFFVNNMSESVSRTDAFTIGVDADTGQAFIIYFGQPVTGTLSNELITVVKAIEQSPGVYKNYIMGYTTANRSELFDGEPHVVHVRYTDDNVTHPEIFIDGVSKTVSIGSNQITDYGFGLTGETEAEADYAAFGASYSGGTPTERFRGNLISSKIWHRKLTDEGILQDYQTCLGLIPGNYQGLFDKCKINIDFREDSLDSAGEGNTPSEIGSPVYVVGPYGEAKGACRLDANTKYINTNLDITGFSEITIVCLYTPNTSGAPFNDTRVLVSCKHSGGDDIRFLYDFNLGTMSWVLDDGIADGVTASLPVGSDAGLHVAIGTYKANEYKLYFDKVVLGTHSSGTFNFAGVQGTPLIGLRGTNLVEHARADFGQVLIYDKALSVGEANSLTDLLLKKKLNPYIRNSLPSPIVNRFQGYWPLDEASGSTAYDHSVGGVDGTITGADRIKVTDGSRALSFVQANSDKLALGNVGNIKTIGLWVELGSTTEKILEISSGGSGFVHASGGTVNYTDFDNCFVNGEDTDTITTDASLLVLTSTTNVNCSALTIALNNATYGDLKVNNIFVATDDMSQEEIKAIYRSTYRR